MIVHVQWTQNSSGWYWPQLQLCVRMLSHHAVQASTRTILPTPGIRESVDSLCRDIYFMLLAACYRRVLCFKQEDRLETEGTPVPVSRLSLHLTATCVFMFSSILFSSWPPAPASTLSPCRPTSTCFSITARLTNTWRYTQSGHIGISPPLYTCNLCRRNY